MGTATAYSWDLSYPENRNISYPYGDSNTVRQRPDLLVVKHFIPLRGQQLRDKLLNGRHLDRNISYPYGDSNGSSSSSVSGSKGNISYPYGDSNPVFVAALRLPVKHFIPLWGQQRQDLIADISANTGNISYPYGDSNVPPQVLKRIAQAKHFIPLWGQQLDRLSIRAK